MDFEIWKDIEGYEGLYQVSNKGNVRTLKWYGGTQIKPITPTDNGTGYKKVGLSKQGKQKQFLVHRLVAMAFIPNPNNYEFVNHKDENKTNNVVENLEWCTKSYNSIYYLNYKPERKKEYADRFKKNPSPMTQRIPKTHIYKVNQYTKDGEFIATYDSPTEASIKTGISNSQIIGAINRNLRTDKQRQKNYRSKAHGFIFERVD